MPSSACTTYSQRKTHQLLIIYKSAVLNFESRMAIRKIYQGITDRDGIALIFSIGLPRYGGGNHFNRDGFNVTMRGRSGKRLDEYVRHPRQDWLQLIDEMKMYDDLLVGEYEDTYYNLTLKMFYSFQWVRTNCERHRPVVLYIDDDFGFNFGGLTKWLERYDYATRDNFCRGYLLRYNPVHRPGGIAPQWALSKREVPWPFHVKEHLGIYSIYGFSRVVDIALAMHFTLPIPIDDVLMAIIEKKLGINCSPIPGMWLAYDTPRTAMKCHELVLTSLDVFQKMQCKLY